MSRFIFDLTDEDRAALERLRIRFGLRSHAEVVRELIRRGDGGELEAVAPAPTPSPVPARQSFSHGRSKTVVVETARRPLVAARPAGPAPLDKAPKKPGTLIGYGMDDKPIYR